MDPKRRFSWLFLIAGAWLFVATAGRLAIADYDAKPCAPTHPPLRAVIDQNGLLAQQFGVQTSGQVLLHDHRGNLQFDGGITPGRWHTGESVGRSLLTAIVVGQTPATPALRHVRLPFITQLAVLMTND